MGEFFSEEQRAVDEWYTGDSPMVMVAEIKSVSERSFFLQDVLVHTLVYRGG